MKAGLFLGGLLLLTVVFIYFANEFEKAHQKTKARRQAAEEKRREWRNSKSSVAPRTHPPREPTATPPPRRAGSRRLGR